MNDWDESAINDIKLCCGHMPMMYDMRKRFTLFCTTCKFKVASDNTRSAVEAWNGGRTK